MYFFHMYIMAFVFIREVYSALSLSKRLIFVSRSQESRFENMISKNESKGWNDDTTIG